jgi:hypothetical protein
MSSSHLTEVQTVPFDKAIEMKAVPYTPCFAADFIPKISF